MADEEFLTENELTLRYRYKKGECHVIPLIDAHKIQAELDKLKEKVILN